MAKPTAMHTGQWLRHVIRLFRLIQQRRLPTPSSAMCIDRRLNRDKKEKPLHNRTRSHARRRTQGRNGAQKHWSMCTCVVCGRPLLGIN